MAKLRGDGDLMKIDNLQQRTQADAGAKEKTPMTSHRPQNAPIKANEEQVGKEDHPGSRRIIGGENPGRSRPMAKQSARSLSGVGRLPSANKPSGGLPEQERQVTDGRKMAEGARGEQASSVEFEKNRVTSGRQSGRKNRGA